MFVYCYVSHGTAVILYFMTTQVQAPQDSHFRGADPLDPNGGFHMVLSTLCIGGNLGFIVG